MEKIISEKLPKSLANEFITKWRTDCKLEEQKSQYIFKKKRMWIEKHLTNELRVKNRNKSDDSNQINSEKEFKKQKTKSRWCRIRVKESKNTKKNSNSR